MTATPYRHRTPGERRAQAAAQSAIARALALAHTTPPPAADPDDPWNGNWPPSPQAWRTRCRQIREDLEESRREHHRPARH